MKAVLQNGVIYPREPLPKDWSDGTELQVEKSLPTNGDRAEELDQWMAKVQASANEVDAEDEIILANSIRQLRQQARELARQEAGQG
jgi:molybdopterin converting factor small subunit